MFTWLYVTSNNIPYASYCFPKMSWNLAVPLVLMWRSLQIFLIKWEGNWGSEISTPSIAGLGLSDYYWHWDVTGNCIRWCCRFSDWLFLGTAELGIAVVVLWPFIWLHLYTEGILTWNIICWLLMLYIACIMTWNNLSICLFILPTPY